MTHLAERVDGAGLGVDGVQVHVVVGLGEAADVGAEDVLLAVAGAVDEVDGAGAGLGGERVEHRHERRHARARAHHHDGAAATRTGTQESQLPQARRAAAKVEDKPKAGAEV